MTLWLLTTRLAVALPTPAPPTRKNTSCREIGLAALFALEPAGPTSISTGELVVPASNSTPADLHPGDVGDRHRGDAVVRDEGGETEPRTTVSAG